MRVGLVIPPSGFMLDERVFPSLGILKVAAVLEGAGHEVAVLDCSGVENYVGAASVFAQGGIDAFGITATTPQMPAAAMIAQVLSMTLKPLILGGPHVTLLNAAAKREVKLAKPGRAVLALQELASRFDVLVAGDGESAVFEALQPGARGVIDADEPSSARFMTPAQLSAHPFPSRHLIDMGSYRFNVGGVPAVSLIGQLGCPFECGFCGGRLSPTFRRVRLRPANSVVGEMRHLHEAYGATGFMFLDDELNVNKGLLALLDEMLALQRELGVTFSCRGLVKSQLFTDEQAERFALAGFRELLIGFESGSERMLTNMNKKATRADNTRCMDIARRHGIEIKALMSIGHPGESEETIRETRDWLLEVKPAQFDVTVITVYPGTPYYDYAEEIERGVWTYTAPKTGDRLHAWTIDQFKDTPFYKGIPGDYKSYVWTDHVRAQDLVRLRDDVEGEVRAKLGIPWPSGAPALQYEHSMGQR